MKNCNISDAEWKVMEVLWKKPNITLKEIAAGIVDAGWSYTTVRTLVTRLMEKGIISADKSVANNFKYSPVTMENECRRWEAKNFVTRVFHGSLSMMVASFTKDSNLTREEEAELLAMIDKIEESTEEKDKEG